MGIPYEIDDDLEVIATTGHTPECVSLIVRNSQLGTVVLSGKISFYPRCVCLCVCRGGGGGGIPYEIDDDVEVIATPGHTPECVSLVVRNSQLGTVVLSGKISFYPGCMCVFVWWGGFRLSHMR